MALSLVLAKSLVAACVTVCSCWAQWNCIYWKNVEDFYSADQSLSVKEAYQIERLRMNEKPSGSSQSVLKPCLSLWDAVINSLEQPCSSWALPKLWCLHNAWYANYSEVMQNCLLPPHKWGELGTGTPTTGLEHRTWFKNIVCQGRVELIGKDMMWEHNKFVRGSGWWDRKVCEEVRKLEVMSTQSWQVKVLLL